MGGVYISDILRTLGNKKAKHIQKGDNVFEKQKDGAYKHLRTYKIKRTAYNFVQKLKQEIKHPKEDQYIIVETDAQLRFLMK